MTTNTSPVVDDAAALGRRLTERKGAAFPKSYRLLERAVFARIGEYAPSYETLRRYHKGEVAPDDADLVVICALTDIYGCRIGELSARLAERFEVTRDLLIRQASWTHDPADNPSLVNAA